MTPDDLAAQMARLEAAWGPPKDRTAGQMAAMAREWFSQLQRFGAKSVDLAFTHVIGANKWEWKGAIVELVEFCLKDDRDWREIVALQLPPPEPPAPEPFERDGRTTAEEIEFRAREIAEMKRLAGKKSAEEIFEEENPARKIKPASQEMQVSEAVLNSKLVRDYRVRARRDQMAPVNQPQSPPTATDDFDGCSDGPN